MCLTFLSVMFLGEMQPASCITTMTQEIQELTEQKPVRKRTWMTRLRVVAWVLMCILSQVGSILILTHIMNQVFPIPSSAKYKGSPGLGIGMVRSITPLPWRIVRHMEGDEIMGPTKRSCMQSTTPSCRGSWWTWHVVHSLREGDSKKF
jgi:hypothetical protein